MRLDYGELQQTAAYGGLRYLSPTTVQIALSLLHDSYWLFVDRSDTTDETLDIAIGEMMASITGQVLWMAGDQPPPGTLLCDGSSHNKADYPAYTPPASLDNGDNTFRTPDLIGRVPRGALTSGGQGGSDTVALQTVVIVDGEIAPQTVAASQTLDNRPAYTELTPYLVVI